MGRRGRNGVRLGGECVAMVGVRRGRIERRTRRRCRCRDSSSLNVTTPMTSTEGAAGGAVDLIAGSSSSRWWWWWSGVVVAVRTRDVLVYQNDETRWVGEGAEVIGSFDSGNPGGGGGDDGGGGGGGGAGGDGGMVAGGRTTRSVRERERETKLVGARERGASSQSRQRRSERVFHSGLILD